MTAPAVTTEPTIAPFAGWLVKPEWADRVISRAHDHLSPQERRAIMAVNPYNYVNVTRSSDDVTEPGLSVEDIVKQSGAALTRLLDEPVFEPTGRPALYLYRMTDETSSQTGVVGTVPLSGFADRSIRIHENVQDDRTELLTRHLLGIGATSTPVAMTLRAPDGLEEAMAAIVAAAPPDLEFGSTAVHHQIWTAPDESTGRLAELMEGQTLYVTDGHHRSAAARRALASDPGDPTLARILAVVFPYDQLHVTSFHRLVADRSRRPAAEVLAALSRAVSVESVMAAEEAWPRRKGELGLYAARSWHRLSLPAPRRRLGGGPPRRRAPPPRPHRPDTGRRRVGRRRQRLLYARDGRSGRAGATLRGRGPAGVRGPPAVGGRADGRGRRGGSDAAQVELFHS